MMMMIFDICSRFNAFVQGKSVWTTNHYWKKVDKWIKNKKKNELQTPLFWPAQFRVVLNLICTSRIVSTK